ncbi:winged helix-turn-helix domain-containing protein [Sabulicella glaciei]|uniref:Winged helix-turn-helix domain-containing protein n=1 Tax=Sabulicella glaciei TaxID=2984948 RepID=A0ABT3P184_9PROT|nr:winged helix-turn-helix domain-containing protein [Roseococcus sp. MDT2-1-1]
MSEELVFGRFVLCPRRRSLHADGVPIELGARAFDLLAALALSNGRLLSKDELMSLAWPGLAVEENNLHVQIGAVRRALGDARDAVINVPGRGYRFGLPLRDAQAAPAPVRLSLAVLSFLSIGVDPAAEALAEGVTDSLTTDLSRALHGGLVVSRTSASAYRGRAASTRQIGEELQVRYVLEGSVALDASRIRVNAQLIDAGADLHVWAERFDQPRDANLLVAQDVIVARLTRLVALQAVLAEAQRIGAGTLADPMALTLRAQGTAISSRMSAEGVAAARELYERALTLDPGNAQALAGLATVEASAVTNGYTSPAERPARVARAEILANKALAAHPGHLGALQVRAVVLRIQGRFADAIVAARAVLERCPGDPPTCREIGLSHLYLGETEASLEWFRLAELSGPQDPGRWTWLQGLGRALLHAGRAAEAVSVLRALVECHPDWAFGHGLLAVALDRTGQRDAAAERFAEFVRRAPLAEARRPALMAPVPPERQGAAYRAGDAALAEDFAAMEQVHEEASRSLA